MSLDESGLAKRVAAACRVRSLTMDALAQQLGPRGLSRIQLTLILAGQDPASYGLVDRLGRC